MGSEKSLSVGGSAHPYKSIVVLTRYTRLGASSRVRFYQYEPVLAAAGFKLQFLPMFCDGYVRGLQAGRRSVYLVVSAYFRRIWQLLFGLKGARLIWVEKECLPWLPAWIEAILLPRNVPLILDYDDAVFHYYDLHPSRFVRMVLGQKHETLNRLAQCAFPGNTYLEAYCLKLGARCTVRIPSAVDTKNYRPLEPKAGVRSKVRVGWVGQRSTVHFLKLIEPVLRALVAEGLIEFVVIGATVDLSLPHSTIAWSEDTEVASIQSLDIGIMPLLDAPFERGKCGYKLIQYMACGLPVVASPVGVNAEIVQHGRNGYLADTPADWGRYIREIAASEEVRCRFGNTGQLDVVEKYSIQSTSSRLISAFDELIDFPQPIV